MRGAIERWFRTMTREALAFWHGRTWGSIEEKGDYNLDTKLTYDMAAKLLYRYLIDIYPNQPHYALIGETPNLAWARLNKFHKPTPPLSPELRRHIFGQKVSRKIHASGIYFLGIRYSSEALQKLFRQKEMVVEARVDRFDLGAISVRHPKGWLTVRSVHQELAGMSVWHWMAFNRRLKLFNKQNAQVPRAIAERAKAALREHAGLKMAEAELGTVILEEEQFVKWEKKLAYRVEIVDDGTPIDGEFEDVDDIESLLGELDDVSATLDALDKATPKAKANKIKDAPTPDAEPGRDGEDEEDTLLDSSFNR